ncbi:unnamed protein product [Nezara viridula]|uniref:Uncharacterized protein n=1 Tax=Nezara viridula TaxID=85310 RepID=A0A9P0H4K2_NEZVI|nr:unnamed protein product [Nezara viridula]
MKNNRFLPETQLLSLFLKMKKKGIGELITRTTDRDDWGGVVENKALEGL